jgi:hypothetical protein
MIPSQTVIGNPTRVEDDFYAGISRTDDTVTTLTMTLVIDVALFGARQCTFIPRLELRWANRK